MIKKSNNNFVKIHSHDELLLTILIVNLINNTIESIVNNKNKTIEKNQFNNK